MIKAFMTLSSAITLAGCSIVGPDFEIPSINLAPEFVLGGTTPLAEAPIDPWWQRLNDPLLDEFVLRGVVQNLSVRAALEHIVAADAALGQTGVNAQTTGALSSNVQRQGNEVQTQSSKSASINAAYVIDIFGGFSRGQERSVANYHAAQFDAGTVRLAYLADLTNSYMQARYYQEAAAITRQAIASRRRTLAIVNQRRAVNEATELEVQQAMSLLASAQAPLPIMVANFEINVFRIATLLAEPAAPLLTTMQSGARQPRPSGVTMTGLPADLLRSRPDIRAAERSFAAATAQIGVAEAQLYPSLQLSGTMGAGTVDFWSFGPFVTVPVFNRGILRSRMQVAASNAREAELAWRETVLNAVEEVQVALTLCRNWNLQIQHLRQAAAASRTVLTLSRQSYQLGETTLTDVLDAERINANNRLALADAMRNYGLSWMRLQVATGRGWMANGASSPLEQQPPALEADPLGLHDVVLAAN